MSCDNHFAIMINLVSSSIQHVYTANSIQYYDCKGAAPKQMVTNMIQILFRSLLLMLRG